MTRAAVVVVGLWLGACGKVPSADHRVDPAPGPLSGAGRVKGGRFTMDVQVGQAIEATPASSGSVTLRPVSQAAE